MVRITSSGMGRGSELGLFIYFPVATEPSRRFRYRLL